nr:hypothetical protein [Tanacetum cinerariifolium]
GDDKHESDEETRDEKSFDPIPQTPEDSEDYDNSEEDLGLNIGEEEIHVEEEEEDELYRDVNINQGSGIQETLEVEDSHVTLTSVKPDGMESIFKTTSQLDVQTPTSVAPLPMPTPTITSFTISTTTTTSQAPIIPTTVLSDIIQNLPSFGSLFQFDDRLRSLEENFSKVMQTNQFSNRLHDEAQRENDEFLRTVDENIQKIIKEQVKEQVKKPPTLDRDWNKTLSAVYESIQPWISELAKQADSCSSFNELMDTPMDFSNFLLNWLRVDTLTPELLAGPTYELIKGSCKSLIELEYHMEEVYKAITHQLDWVNLEGASSHKYTTSVTKTNAADYKHIKWIEDLYPHNLLKPLPLISNNQGRRVIPFEHFINNDIEYLRGGASSRKYITSITKTNAADYMHIKWIKDLVPRTIWIKEPIGYDKHALWRVSHWGHKRQQFYGFVVNRESARDVYSKRRIITVTELKIVEWHNYKHLDWITNKDKKNRLMQIDKLHKFSDGTLIDVCTAVDDRLKGIQMQYLPQSIWRKSDKDRAAAMIQAIDKRLKTRRIMRSLKRFVGGRLYEGDFRMLQRTI